MENPLDQDLYTVPKKNIVWLVFVIVEAVVIITSILNIINEGYADEKYTTYLLFVIFVPHLISLGMIILALIDKDKRLKLLFTFLFIIMNSWVVFVNTLIFYSWLHK